MTAAEVSLGDVLLGASGAIGADVQIGGRGSLSTARSMGLPPVRRVCVVIVDGLGWENLHQRAAAAPTLTASRRSPIRAALPTTTATNMAFLGTGLGPGLTGMLGYSVRNPQTGTLLNLIHWRQGPDPESWQRCPTVFELLAQIGVPSVSIGPWEYESSPLTAAALRGAEYEAAQSLRARVDAAVDVLAEPGPGLVTLYWAEVDRVGHQLGWESAAWAHELAAVDAAIARLSAAVPQDTLVLVVADHGMVDIPFGDSGVFDGPARLDVATDPRLSDEVELVAGEPRFVHLHTTTGAAQAVADRWRARLGPRAEVLRREEAIEQGWFGPVDERHRDVIGDVVAAMAGDQVVVDSRVQSEGSMSLVGMHGSQTSAESLVPLIVIGPR